MNKNITIRSVMIWALLFVRINASVNNNYEQIANMNSSQIENLYANATGTKDKFEIALFAGRGDLLASLPNQKKWLTNALFHNKNTVYVNDLINETIELNSIDGLTKKSITKTTTALHLALEIAALHRLNSYEVRATTNNLSLNTHDNKYKNMIQTIQFLIDNGADVNITNSNGKTPLHIACEKGEYKGAMILLDAGADPRISDSKGRVAKDFINNKSPMLDRHSKQLTKQLELATKAIEHGKQQEIEKVITKGLYKETIIAPQESNKKNVILEKTIYLGNIAAEVAPSTSSDTTTSLRSDRRATLTRDGHRQLNLKPEASTASIEDSLFIAKSQTKPTIKQRPASASINRKVTPLNSIASQGNLLMDIDNNIEIRQEITRTKNTTARPATGRPKPKEPIPSEYVRAQTMVKSSTVASQRSTTKVYAAK